MNIDARQQLIRDAQALSALTMGLCVARHQFFEAMSETRIDAFFDMLRTLAEKVETGVVEVSA
ncbi:hypothetical protein [Burkholderia sp. Bp9099]|uniref:hypothetical protein n=1 Tax=Burkholderia sp. Bp9099 TaxID=2184568 RepID=UPI000F5EAC08|nr:hypothetical protein [Burkholderia sp. Bp9099]RQZ46073.1 hypothetical protein DIE17_18605 [Burkholderia sp. Bp9099]